jgi:hypothetical protein
MERPPYIDDHARTIGATPEHVWAAVVRFFGGDGRWFTVATAEPPRRLVLRGSHWFSIYELRFDLEPLEPGQTLLRATTFAAFPGITGRLYRMLVIGTRGHVLAVRRLLGAVAERAESAELRRPYVRQTIHGVVGSQ